jgi:hypothetical protein
MTEGRKESQQLDPIQIQGILQVTEGTPITLRTRRGRQQLSTESMMVMATYFALQLKIETLTMN